MYIGVLRVILGWIVMFGRERNTKTFFDFLAGCRESHLVLREPQHERKFSNDFNPSSVRPELCRRMNGIFQHPASLDAFVSSREK